MVVLGGIRVVVIKLSSGCVNWGWMLRVGEVWTENRCGIEYFMDDDYGISSLETGSA